MHVRDKVLTLVGSWHEAFGGLGRRYPQYYMAYEDLRVNTCIVAVMLMPSKLNYIVWWFINCPGFLWQRFGVQFPNRPPDAAPIHTPRAIHAVSTPPPGYGMSSSSSTRLGEATKAEDTTLRFMLCTLGRSLIPISIVLSFYLSSSSDRLSYIINLVVYRASTLWTMFLNSWLICCELLIHVIARYLHLQPYTFVTRNGL